MAEINQFGKGIALNCGFDLGAQQLLDSRSIVADRTELEAIPNIRRANGLLVWIQDEKKLVAWDEPNSAWVEVSGGFNSEEYKMLVATVGKQGSDLVMLKDTELYNTQEANARIDALTSKVESLENATGDDTFYSDKSYSLTSAHGGLASGTDVAGWKIKDILKNILFPLNVPKLNIFGTSDIYKLGDYSNVPTIELGINYGDFDVNTPVSLLRNNSQITTLNDAQKTSSIYEVVEEEKCVFKATTTPNISSDETDPAILAWVGKTITSNILTTYAVRPLFFAWSTVESPEFPKVIEDIYAPVSANASYTWSTDPVELLTRSKTVTLSFPAQTTAARMVIVSPYKISKILNPSSFDITSSFTLTQGTVSYRDEDVNDERFMNWSPNGIVPFYETPTYFYVSNQTSQEKAYPLTVTFV